MSFCSKKGLEEIQVLFSSCEAGFHLAQQDFIHASGFHPSKTDFFFYNKNPPV